MDEDVVMPEFAQKFGFHSESIAHPLFEMVIQSTTIPYATRKRFIQQYTIWRKSHGEEFWADKASVHRIRVSTKKALREIVSGSDPIRERYIDMSSHSMLLLGSSSNSFSDATSNQGPQGLPPEHKRESEQPKVVRQGQTTVSTTTTTTVVPAQTVARKSRLTFAPLFRTTSQTTTPVPAPLATQPMAESCSSHTKASTVPTTTLSKQKANVAGLRLPEPWRSLMEMAKALVSYNALICLAVNKNLFDVGC
ncbi:hypothetical protein BGX21_003076 [Mortierella sp. AD011]|nr:hypothetical protein BGX21_003076 [Mortierella sp. AD011]